MATFPSHVKLVPRDNGESHASVVQSSDMERGPPKRRRVAADALTTLRITAVFDNAQRAEDFLTWFRQEINMGADSFDFTHPRTKQVLEGWIAGGDIGELRPLGAQESTRYARSFQIQYMWSTLP